MTSCIKTLIGGLAVLATASFGWAFSYITNPITRLPVKWPSGAIPLSLKVDSTTILPGDGTTRAGAIQAAAQAWNVQLGAAQFASQVQPVTSASYGNSLNEVVFASTIYGDAFDSRTLAVALSRRSGNESTEADIIFNSGRTWDSYRDAKSGHGDAFDIQRVAIHELGHVLGLDHPDEATPPQSVQAIMNSTISDVAAATSDDVAGAQRLYGPLGIPANNPFASALPLALATGSLQVTGFNTNATVETGEPRHANNDGGRSVWWRWTAPAPGRAELNTQGSVFDTTLGVYSGAALGTLATVASSDDLDPEVTQYSTLTFAATTGTTYYFAVDGFDGDTGFVALNLTFVPMPGHSADSAPANGEISLTELVRVIELYNVRNGTLRTGRYSVATTTTTDGFAPDPLTANAASVVLTRYHSADTNQDGKLSLRELTRLIELYQARNGIGTRTGQYRLQTNTEDGFAPGP